MVVNMFVLMISRSLFGRSTIAVNISVFIVPKIVFNNKSIQAEIVKIMLRLIIKPKVMLLFTIPLKISNSAMKLEETGSPALSILRKRNL